MPCATGVLRLLLGNYAKVYNAQRFGVDVAGLPTVTRVFEALSGIEAFQKAHPSAQPDSEETSK